MTSPKMSRLSAFNTTRPVCVFVICVEILTVPVFRNPDQVRVLKKGGANKSHLDFQSFNLTASLRPTGAKFRDTLHLLANDVLVSVFFLYF